ncbi:MAG: Na+/H+ antiporter NhaC family protein [Eggerthellaceae bacterium]|nr:Na+/H+ antiporter NhaC family protein [Eggerthellaceae bacterium]
MELLVIVAFCIALLACVATGLPILLALAVGFVLVAAYGLWKGFSVREVLCMAGCGVWSARNVLLNFALIGMMCALWRASGTVPSVICYASEAITPETFLVMAFVLNCLVSMITGTAFGTSAVMGVVCMTIGQAAGVPLAFLGGAIVSGAYFGDRCSPVSTSALLVSELTGTTVPGNIAGMVKTAAVPFALCCVVYLVIGLLTPSAFASPDLMSLFSREIAIQPIALLPIAIVLVLCACRARVAIALAAGIAAAAALCIVFQHDSAWDVVQIAVVGYQAHDSEVGALLSGGGIASMLSVSAIVCVSSSYAGMFRATGLLDRLRNGVGEVARRTTPFAATLLASVGAAMVCCNQTLAIMLTHQLSDGLERDGHRQALDLENTAVVVSALVPWSIACTVPLMTIGAPLESLGAALFLYALPLWQLACSFAHRFRLFGHVDSGHRTRGRVPSQDSVA